MHPGEFGTFEQPAPHGGDIDMRLLRAGAAFGIEVFHAVE